MKISNFLQSLLFSAIALLLVSSCGSVENSGSQGSSTSQFAVVVHGGAGYIKNLPPEVEKRYEEGLQNALNRAYAVLEQGGSAVAAVEAAIRYMEDDSIFNAGRGSVLTNKGGVEMDASIMDGKTLNAGAVARVKHIKNPISAARLVMDSCRHVFLVGDGAEEFALEYGLQLMPEEYFILEKRKKQLKRIHSKQASLQKDWDVLRKYGTVGCVAMDKNGNLAAGTSTGGMMNKRYGRVGDSPIIGAGTYADNQTCAVSATGTGENFIRTAAAFRVSALMQYLNKPLDEALRLSIEKMESTGGDGGFIGIDKNGHISWYFNTEGMFRGYKTSSGEQKIEMYHPDYYKK